MSHKTILSPDRQYRYELWRFWPDDLLHSNKTKQGYVMFIGLNPSTADETNDDATIRRCVDFTKRWGYLELCMTNLFAFRTSSPKEMKSIPNPVGNNNQHHLLNCAAHAAIVVAAWGKDGKHRQQDLTVRQWLSGIGVKLHHLGLNNDGSPKHPLYLKSTTQPTEWIL